MMILFLTTSLGKKLILTMFQPGEPVLLRASSWYISKMSFSPREKEPFIISCQQEQLRTPTLIQHLFRYQPNVQLFKGHLQPISLVSIKHLAILPNLLSGYYLIHEPVKKIPLSMTTVAMYNTFQSRILPEHPREVMRFTTDSLFPLAEAQQSWPDGVSFFKDFSELFQEL